MDLRTTPMDLGEIGVWTSTVIRSPAAETRRVVAEIESLGFLTLWFPESFGKEIFSLAATILGATERLVVGTGIANLWARDPLAATAGASTLADAFPGRFLLGIGVSHAPLAAQRGHHYRSPMDTMRRYLDAMEAATYNGPDPGFPTVLAALGPRMLALAVVRTGGAHPYFVPVDHTRMAREIMGPAALLAPELAIVLDGDPMRARETARIHTTRYLGLDNYRRNLERLGWPDADLTGGGSDALVDAVVAWGDEAAIAARTREHLAAGADHVCVQVIQPDPDTSPVPQLRRMAAAFSLS